MAFVLRRAVPVSRASVRLCVGFRDDRLGLLLRRLRAHGPREAEIVLNDVGRLGHRGLLETGNSRQLTAVSAGDRCVQQATGPLQGRALGGELARTAKDDWRKLRGVCGPRSSLYFPTIPCAI
jgi:hypothetical protein